MNKLIIIWYRFINPAGEEVEGKVDVMDQNRESAIRNLNALSDGIGLDMTVIKSLDCGHPPATADWN